MLLEISKRKNGVLYFEEKNLLETASERDKEKAFV